MKWPSWDRGVEIGWNCLVLCLCCWDVLCGEGREGSGSLWQATTSFQKTIMMLTMGSYWWDLLRHWVGWEPLGQAMVVHHLGGSAGLGFLLYFEIGGSLITRLLLDIVTELISYFEEIHNALVPVSSFSLTAFHRHKRWEIIYWVAFLIVRTIAYPVILIGQLVSSTPEQTWQWVLWVMVALWTVFISFDHGRDFISGGLPVFSEYFTSKKKPIQQSK